MAQNYNKYRELVAKFDSQASCGHPTKKGDVIGWASGKPKGETQCAECWRKWTAEVMSERDDMAMMGGY